MSPDFEPIPPSFESPEGAAPLSREQAPEILDEAGGNILQQFGDTVIQAASSETDTTEPNASPVEPPAFKRKAGKHKGTVPQKAAPKPPKQGRGHPMKQTKAHLSQKGKLNAKAAMPAEQRKLRRKKRRR